MRFPLKTNAFIWHNNIKGKLFMAKRIITILVVVAILIGTVVLIFGSTPPEYAEIEGRFKELIEASYDINTVLFGIGLPIDERIYDPRTNQSVYELIGENEEKSYVYYYYTDDENYGKILWYSRFIDKKRVETYLQVLETEDTSRELKYFNEEKGWYYYETDYTPPEVGRYYTLSDPDNYDYVSDSSPYHSIEQIKAAAEQVYSMDYLESIYETLFTGADNSDENVNLEVLSARYIEYMPTDAASTAAYLMQSNNYPPLVTERRIYDFSTAKVVRPGNKKLVNIEIETYLESSPENRLTVRVTMVKQDGAWYLDSGTY